MAYIVTILLCIAADQAVKLWTVAHLALFETRPLLPGLVELCYVQNTGGGFSILAQYTWLLTAVTAAAGFYAVRMAKNLNLYRLSSDYAVSMGVDVRRLRFGIVAVSSVLAAFVTAFCGPTAFVGIAAPRLAVIFFRSDDCRYRVPAAALSGALLTTAADLAAKLPGLWTTALPLNPVLSFFGLPFVFAVLLGERRELSGE